jgi:cathepsin C
MAIRTGSMFKLAGAIIFGAVSVAADLPVHCLRHQVQGQWEFTLGPLSGDRPSCGHKHPDAQDAEPALRTLDDGAGAGDGQSSKMTMELSSPDRASTPMDPSGSFTMIYDEGFEVVAEGKTFFAFSRFDMVNGKNQTHCGETLTGWYRENNQNQFGCYWGKRTDFNDAVLDQ